MEFNADQSTTWTTQTILGTYFFKNQQDITNTIKKRYFDTSLPQVPANPTGAITYITLTDVRLKDEYVVVQFYPWLIYFTSLCF